ncbi:MAG: PilN domain-containing protein [Methylovulum sp.]|jgi:type IV pilus assembly protein PilN|nr:PilN domain-containing protein [Methylovulum sp.]MCF7998855.1 PilN domain-containing protein [Methylovulum sp.]
MAKINLLPWREELRKKKKRAFLIALGISAGFAVLVLGLAHSYVDSLKFYQEQRNQFLQKEITLMDAKITAISGIEERKRKLLSKIDLIQKLQKSRPEIVHLFDELPRITPDGIYLTKFSQTGENLLFEGNSQSNARVSAFMRGIEASHWLQMPLLDIVKSSDKKNSDDSSIFTLRAKQGNGNANTSNEVKK